MTNSGASAFAWSCDIQGGEVNRGEPVINGCRGVFEEGVNDEQGFGKVLGASNRPSRADVVLKEVREKHERGIAIAHVPFRSERAGNMRGIRTAVAWRWDILNKKWFASWEYENSKKLAFLILACIARYVQKMPIFSA